MTAALCMSAIDDHEDDPPHHHLRAMPVQDDERTDTERAERDTTPPGPADIEATRVLSTMLPAKPPLSLEDSYLDRAIRVVATTGTKIDEDREERRRQHEAVLAAITRADDNGNKNYELLRDEIRHLKDSDLKQDRRLKEGDDRFARIEESIADLAREMKPLTERIKALEDDLAEAKKNVTARTAQAPSPTG